MAFATQLPNVFNGLGAAITAAGSSTAGTGINVGSRATITLGNKPFLDRKPQKNLSISNSRGWNNRLEAPTAVSAAALEPGAFTAQYGWNRNLGPADFQPVAQYQDSGRLPQYLQRLVDPEASADFPPAHRVDLRSLDNRELDKLVAALGRNKSTWRRAMQLHEWLQGLGHVPDDRLCTTLMRVCSQHGHSLEALSLYEWMRTPKREGGAGLRPSVYTYTGAMRAALVGNLPDRAFQVWDDAMKAGCQIDCRMCTTLVEVCTRKGHTDRALSMYELMRDAQPGSKLAPTVHAYTAAMRGAAEGGRWQRALEIWRDMETAGCTPSGHAYAAAISACAAGGKWEEAVKMFDNMMMYGIKPDVVSCTALITALAADGQWERSETVIDWMLKSGVKPNVRTYTALITAMGNAKQWRRALATIESMKHSQAWSNTVEPNAYTYSALLKSMSEQGEWKMAEDLFDALEAEALGEVAPPVASLGRVGQTINGESSTSGRSVVRAQELRLSKLTLADRSSSQGSLGSLEFGSMPTALAEEVLKSNSPKLGSTLPEDIPGQSNVASHESDPAPPFSFFSAGPMPSPDSVAAENIWTFENAAIRGLQTSLPSAPQAPRVDASVWVATPAAVPEDAAVAKPVINPRTPLNEVVCGAMMLAYERAGCWQQAVNMLQRARNMGIEPNTIMYNTAISTLGKSGCWEAAEQLFGQIPSPDTVSHETMIAAYGLAGQSAKAEAFFTAMLEAGHMPRDYAFCGLIAAYSGQGDWRSALKIRARMHQLGCTTSVHVFNALIAVCERANQWDQALALHRTMKAEGVMPNQVTQKLLESVGKGGITAVEEQQVAAAALTAAVAAAGSLIIKAGII